MLSASTPPVTMEEVVEALEKIEEATCVPEHKKNDTEFLRASTHIAHSFASAILTKLREEKP